MNPMTVFFMTSTFSFGIKRTTTAQRIGINVISERIGNPRLFIDYIPPNIGMAFQSTITITAKNMTTA